MKKRVPLILFLILFSPCIASAADLVGYWNFNELAGSTVYDQSSYGNDGTLTGATHSSGKYGNGLYFDQNGGVTVPHSPSLDSFPDGFTMEAWIEPTGYFSNYMTIFYKTDRYERSDMLHFQVGGFGTSVGNLYGCMNGVPGPGGSCNMEGITAPVVPLNQWSYAAWTFDNSIQTFYLNGDEVFSSPYSGSWLGNQHDLQIGQNNQLPQDASFYGYIDEARIYNGVLTRDEILRDMNGGNVIPEPSTLLLLASGLLGLPLMKRKK